MALEASIMERLQELRRWQVEQQERLLLQQQEQREMLNREQDRMYQALGLSFQEASLEETSLRQIISEDKEGQYINSSPLEADGDTPTKHYKDMLKKALGEDDYTQHFSPQRRHELLHGESQDLIKNPQDVAESQSISMEATQNKLEGNATPQQEQDPPFETNNNDISLNASTDTKDTGRTLYDSSTSPSVRCSDTRVDVPAIESITSKIVSGKSDKNFIGLSREMGRSNADLESRPLKQHGQFSGSSIEGIEPLSLGKPLNKQFLIDDMPVPSPRKDFETLLEERLRDSGAMPENTMLETGARKQQVKKPFLKKGQGLARFRVNSISENPPKKKIRPRTMSLPGTVRPNSAKNVINIPEISKTIKKGSAQRKSTSVPGMALHKLNLKNVAPPVRPRSKSMSIQYSKNDNKLNSSDIETKTKREMEEVRIFELLEEKAENSSFCSTSSTVVALLQHSVQSTPLKAKNMRGNSLSNMQEQVQPNQKQNRSEESLLAEIVRTTRSNLITHASTNGYKRVIRNPKRDADSLIIDENSLNSCNNNIFLKQRQKYNPSRSSDNDVSSNTELDYQERICELPYGTDVDTAYDAEYSKAGEIDPKNDNCYQDTAEHEEKKNISLHVRFAEYNEYKMLTDTSIMSNESEGTRQFSDDRAWSDCSATTDSSDVESLPIKIVCEETVLNSQGRLRTNFRGEHIDQCVLHNQSLDLKDDSQTKKQYLLKTKNSKVTGEQFQDRIIAQSHTNDIFDNSLQAYDSENDYYNSSKPHIDRLHLNDEFNDKYPEENSSRSVPHQDYRNDKQSKVSKVASDEELGETADEIETEYLTESHVDFQSKSENEISTLIDSTLIDVEQELNTVKTEEESGTIFKSELLKTRLLELEREIDIFRKENTALAVQREKLQEERKRMEMQFKEKENNLEERKRRTETALQEEKKRLTREKSALENRLKDAQVKAQQGKQERQEVQSLRDQLQELREEMNQKEGRWSAAQARHRSQVRILQTENSKLKQELERMQISKKSNSKARNLAKPNVLSNTKAIHQINKQLENQRKVQSKQISSSDEDERMIQPMMAAMHLGDPIVSEHRDLYPTNSTDGSKIIIYEKTNKIQKNSMSASKKRELYDDLLKDATMGLRESEEAGKRAVEELDKERTLPLNNHHLRSFEKAMKPSHSDSLENDIVNSKCEYDSNESEINRILVNDTKCILDNNVCQTSCIENRDRADPMMRNNERYPNVSDGTNSQDNSKLNKHGVREVVHSDGRIEFWYPNGNVKKISADGKITKMIYYNGDVREGKKDGSVKYFYAATRTWHTTMPDGLQILEFPDGQVERRSKNGAIEVSFPDGSVRTLQSDGSERWALPDGTVAETSADGEKILTLPNGQREVHTKDHKRREYPDGTVKLVYLDGSQETRYASGRIRLKDKDGNLIMDSHHQ